jgi:parvulin-like peptidyl-prolyl isomerase
MRHRTRWTSITCVILLLIFRPYPAPAIEDAIIAVVNDELITLKDLKDYVQSTYVSLVAEGMPDAQIREVMKDMEINGTIKLIEDKLILSQANTLGLQVREVLVDERLETLKANYGSEQKLVDALIKNGATLTDLRNKIRDQLKIKFIVDHEVKDKIFVNPQEVTEYYENNKQQFARQERINLESIFVGHKEDKNAAQGKMDEVLKRIGEGTEFSSLMKEYSEAPSVGVIEHGQLLPEVEKVVFNLSPHEISPPVETDNGIFIFRLIGNSPAETASLESVKDHIYETISNEKFRKQFRRWVDQLKKDAYIEIKQ